ncbi:pantoate--beta-alanine ligase [soil metagenome]
MNIVRTVAELRTAIGDARRAGVRVGLVPTMGAFHDGHLSLMRRAKAASGFVVVSLFVNPTQFNEISDLARYPRDEQRDVRMAEGAGVDLLFAPAVEEVYPDGFATTVEVSALAEPLEGVVRGAQHFRGVATVVTKLLNMVQPDDAYFGQKDAQQALIIRRLVLDLDLPVRVQICPTLREPDGLAMSSRNVLLDAVSRTRAVILSKALFAIEGAARDGERRADVLLERGRAILDAEQIVPEYLAIVDARTLAPVGTVNRETLVPIAVRFGSVRLIDNVLIGGAV